MNTQDDEALASLMLQAAVFRGVRISPSDDDEGLACVPALMKPGPQPNRDAIALPEPEDGAGLES